MKSGLESWQFSSILLFLCDSEILPDKRGRLWWVWPYKRGKLWWVWSYKRGRLWWVWPYKRGRLVGVA